MYCLLKKNKDTSYILIFKLLIKKKSKITIRYGNLSTFKLCSVKLPIIYILEEIFYQTTKFSTQTPNLRNYYPKILNRTSFGQVV